MQTLAVVTPSLHIIGGLDGWRRTTGVLRAHAAALTLHGLLHPEDADEARAAIELARWRSATARVRLGYYDRRVLCEMSLERWCLGRSVLVVRALRPLPVSAWWVPDSTFGGLPAMPNTLLA